MALNYNFISQEFQNISTDKISEICKQVEKVISSVNVKLTTELPSEVKDMLNIILLLTSEKHKRDDSERILTNIFSNPEVAAGSTN